MLKLLIKKQIYELFRGFFFDRKNGKVRTKTGSVIFIALYALLIVGVLGGTFAFVSASMCGAMSEAGADWLYFSLMSAISLTLGVFGSVFNTYASLYMAKDNDLLLSMPIPVGVIMASRLLGVYLLGLMFSIVASLPAVIVYMIITGFTAAKLIGGIMYILIISLAVFILSCFLGWIIAKLSTRIKNKSFTTVLASLIFIGGYYFVYFKAVDYVNYIVLNVLTVSASVAEKAAFVRFFGLVGVGNALSIAVCLAVTLTVLAVLVYIMSRTFVALAVSSGSGTKTGYKERRAKQQSIRSALLKKELSRFASSASYMLNCGLGIVIEPVVAVVLLIKGQVIREALLGTFAGFGFMIVIAAFAFIISMNDFTAPSVSLEGKSLWVVHSMPVSPWYPLRAKLDMHMVLSVIPALPLLAVCIAVLRPDTVMGIFMVIIPLLMIIFMGEFGLFLGVLKPTLNYTNEVYVIKQSIPPLIFIFSAWGVGLIFGGVYYLLIEKLSAELYCLIFSLILIAACVYLRVWLEKKGARIFASL